jgi:hypothetical protein
VVSEVLRLELVEQMPLAETAVTELRQRLAPVAPAEQVVRQQLTLHPKLQLVATAATAALPQPELVATVERVVQQVALLRVRLPLVESVVLVATQPAEHLELAEPAEQPMRTVRPQLHLVVLAVLAERQLQQLVASAVSEVPPPVLMAQDLAARSAVLAGSEARQHQALVALAASAVLLHRRHQAPTATLARQRPVVPVE